MLTGKGKLRQEEEDGLCRWHCTFCIYVEPCGDIRMYGERHIPQSMNELFIDRMVSNTISLSQQTVS